MPWKDRSSGRAREYATNYHREWRRRNAERVNEERRERYKNDPDFRRTLRESATESRARKYAEAKDELADVKRASGCVVCAEDEPAVLVFHHVDQSTKAFSISAGLQSRVWRMDEVRAEIAKCVVLCGNCHRKLHAGKVKLP